MPKAAKAKDEYAALDFDSWTEEAEDAALTEFVESRPPLRRIVRDQYVYYETPEGKRFKLSLNFSSKLLLKIMRSQHEQTTVELFFTILDSLKTDPTTAAVIDDMDMIGVSELAQSYISLIAKVTEKSLGKFGS